MLLDANNIFKFVWITFLFKLLAIVQLVKYLISYLEFELLIDALAKFKSL